MAHDAGQRCLCVSEHRPAPLELDRHHIQPRYLDGPDTPGNVEWVCPSTHRNTHEVLSLLLTRGRLTYTEVAAVQPHPLSRYAYALALRGYDDWRTSQP